MRPKIAIIVIAAAAIVLGALLLVPKSNGPAAAVGEQTSNAHTPAVATSADGTAVHSSTKVATAREDQSGQVIVPEAAARSQAGGNTAETVSSAAPLVQNSVKPAQIAPAKTDRLEEEHEAAVTARVNELMDLASNDDADSLRSIVGEFNNPDPEIRKAAIDATIQFGSKDAIPYLENAAPWAATAQEKKEFDDAIEFLKLPPLTEALSELQAHNTVIPPPKTTPSSTLPNRTKR
ncbi:MAG TPA: hypothetical protein VLT36_25675 [Candidatus Dormibacteraeota bacterium]|nr:hypothetical protein [Candidatus Dormibacteraeota bacterium]